MGAMSEAFLKRHKPDRDGFVRLDGLIWQDNHGYGNLKGFSHWFGKPGMEVVPELGGDGDTLRFNVELLDDTLAKILLAEDQDVLNLCTTPAQDFIHGLTFHF